MRITFGCAGSRLFFFFFFFIIFSFVVESNSYRRDYWLDWPCQRLTILSVSRSKLTERNSIRTQSNWRLALQSRRSLVVVLLLQSSLLSPFFFFYFYFSFFSCISLLLPSVLFYPIPLVLYSLLYSSTRFSSQRHREKRSSSSFLCKRAISSRCFI